MRKLGDSYAFRFRGKMGKALFAPAFLVLLFSRPVVEKGGLADLGLYTAGWLFFTLYLGFRLWATLYVGGRKDTELQTEGPYSITRNPLYVGTFCLALSTACFFKSFSLLALIFIGFIIYSRLVITAEEGVLEDIFGQSFRSYCERTPRFFPSFSRYRTPETITIKLVGLRDEFKRLRMSVLMPIAAAVVSYLHSLPSWPAWFRLP
jgi:protein-S-isoprenylcysteine O-methyltransferase Ste14